MDFVRKAASKFQIGMDKMSNLTVVRAIRDGLVVIIPVLIIGAFSLIIKTFPVPAYQTFIKEAMGGFIYNLFDIIYCATFGVLSVYMTISIGVQLMKIHAEKNIEIIGAVIASVISFFILAGVYLPDFGLDATGPKSVFLALLTGLGATELYRQFSKLFRQRRRTFYTTGANRTFNRMITTITPIAIVAVIFTLFNEIVILAFNVGSFKALMVKAFDWMFSFGGAGFGKGFLFVFLSSFLWFFGIHGSDTLETVMQTYFVPGLAANQAAVASGNAATTVLTKEFFDCFVLMGGCGTTICLLIAILIFSKNRARKGLGATAAFPMIFNINELMVFGLPIIFNPIMLIPFMATPLVCYCTAYLAIATGMVPAITGSVEWTTPIILGGYQATGSAAGSILQVINLAIGVLIYLPFVKLLDKKTAENLRRSHDEFMVYFHQHEPLMNNISLTEKSDIYGDFAKDLAAVIEHNYAKFVNVYYQPQYNYEGKCFGCEALLRYEHPDYGLLYPPLVIKLAEETGVLLELEEEIFNRVVADIPKVKEKFGQDIEVSVNVTGSTIVNQRFFDFLSKKNQETPFQGLGLSIEVTEQAALSFSLGTYSLLRGIHDMGIALEIDDFSMGQTSLHYLKYNLFDTLKIDGSLVQGLQEGQNCKEIISSITQLASSLNLKTIAEFVDSEAQKEILHEIGCDQYQGYLYSPAVPLEEKPKEA